MRSAAAKTLHDLGGVFGELTLRWYLFGAQAAIHYGSPRSTADVDITVELGELDLGVLIDSLARAGIVSRIALDDAFIAEARVLPLVHRGTGMGVDVVLAGPGLEASFLDRAQKSRFEGVPVVVASPTDMVIMKVLAGREKDLDDLVGIIRSAPKGLDLHEAEAALTDLEQLLGQSDLVPMLHEAIGRAS